MQKEIYQIVREAHELSAAAIEQLIQVREIDKIARDHITENGYGDDFLHGLGHGVGYYIHEPPMITQSFPLGEQPLRLWDVVTIEPGIYIQNASKGGGEIFGMRIEDDYGVGLSGPERFTHFSWELEDVIILPLDDDGSDGSDGFSDTFLEENQSFTVVLSLLILMAIPWTAITLKKRRSMDKE